jgi:uncharacterized membrane protein (DUF4010 family)
MSTPQLAVQAPRRVVWMYWRPFWAAVAILGMWIVVLVDAVWGTDIVATTAGGDTTTFPAAILIAFFVSIATVFVARYGFRSDEQKPS